MSTPFIIYALPRSRTAWLSNFLTYRAWECHHEAAIFMRSMEDVKAFFSSPKVGCAETAVVLGRELIRSVVPDIKEVVILRPVDEVIESVMKVDLTGVASYDRFRLQKVTEHQNRALQKVAKDKNVLVINYADLNREEACAAIFEYCLPFKFDKEWWKWLKDTNIQIDLKAMLGYYHKNKDAIEGFKKTCKSELRRLVESGSINREMRA